MTLYGKVVKQCDCLRCTGDMIASESFKLLIFHPVYKGQCNKCNEIRFYDLSGQQNDAFIHRVKEYEQPDLVYE